MILRNISRADAIRYGLLQEDQLLAADPDPEFNDGLAVTLLNAAPDIIRALKTFLPNLRHEGTKAVLT
jgi:hypothetical protein